MHPKNILFIKILIIFNLILIINKYIFKLADYFE